MQVAPPSSYDNQKCLQILPNGPWGQNHFGWETTALFIYLNLKKWFIYFIWGIITLHYCDGFGHTSTWLSHRYTCVPPFWSPLPPLSPPYPSGLSRSTDFRCPASGISLEDSHFTVLCWLCHTTTWISHVYACVPSILNLLFTPHPIPPLEVVTEHGVELPMLYSNLPLAIYCTYGSVYVSVLLSWFVPTSPSSAVSTSLFPMSESLFLPCR